jgi:TRAP-type C4-dicarboxylate transport system substrate-binding protein
MTKRKTILGLAAGLAFSALSTTGAFAQEVTLKLEHFLPAQANVPKLVLDVWADNVEKDSGGRIKIDRYPTMSLGGTPPELMDQIIDGVVDIGWTVVGYTPGRFPTTEVFELPFMVSDARSASCAYWKLYDERMKNGEFSAVHMIGTWVHGPGLIHSNVPVRTPSDMQGLKIRGGSTQVNKLLETIGATPVGMPVPAVSEALSKGVIDGTTIPWEVTTSLKVPELVHNHTEFTGKMLYTLTFVLAMNKEKYDSLPADLQKVIDDNSGLSFSVFAGGTQADADGPARQVAVDLGNNIITLNAEETQPWIDVAKPLWGEWEKEMDGKGYDGEGLVAEAQSLMDQCHADMSSIDTYGKM